jgi:hypothetical protein
MSDTRRIGWVRLLPCILAGSLVAGSLPAQRFTTERHRLLPPTNANRAVAADFDGNGSADLAIHDGSAFAGGNLQIAWNDGQGRFRTAGGPYPSGPYTVSFGPMAAGDIDGDGDFDLAGGGTLFFAYAPCSMLRNDGPAGFVDVSTQWPTANEAPTDVLFVDYDGDGDQDLVTANSWSRAALEFGLPQPINGLYLNDGAGTFANVTPARMPNTVHLNTGVAAGDLDGDGRQDLVFSAGALVFGQPGSLRVFLQNALGNAVEAPGRVPAPAGFTGSYLDVAAVDFDGDGDPDLVGAASDGVHVFGNQGGASFQLVAMLPDPAVRRLHVGDFDGDGRPDLLLHRQDAFEREILPLRLFRNTPAGFVDVSGTALELPDLGPTDLTLLDADGDGDLDLWGALAPQPVLWHNDGQGRLLLLAGRDLSGGAVTCAALGDADGDGDLDAAVVERTRTSFAVAFAPNDGNGPGPRRERLVAPSQSRRAQCVQFVDADRDGDLDLFVGMVPGGVASVWNDLLLHRQGGSYVEVTASRMPPGAGGTETVAAGDLDRDGFVDLVTAGLVGRLYRGDGSGGFLEASTLLPASSNPPTGVALLDFDADGDLDIAQSLSPPWATVHRLRLLRNDWPGPFVDVTNGVLPPLTAVSIAGIDIDRDGRQDLVLSVPLVAGSTSLRVFRSVGAGFVEETTLRAPVTGILCTRFTVADIDGDGWSDLLGHDNRYGYRVQYRNVQGVLSMFPTGILDRFGEIPATPAIGDVDADGDPDLVFGIGLVRNRARDLMDAVPPRVGAAAELVLQAWAGNGTDPQAVALLLAQGRAPAPLALPGLGTLFLDPATATLHSLHVIAPTGGESIVGYAVPPQPRLLGAVLSAQALFFHEPARRTWRLGNAVDLTIRL